MTDGVTDRAAPPARTLTLQRLGYGFSGAGLALSGLRIVLDETDTALRILGVLLLVGGALMAGIAIMLRPRHPDDSV